MDPIPEEVHAALKTVTEACFGHAMDSAVCSVELTRNDDAWEIIVRVDNEDAERVLAQVAKLPHTPGVVVKTAKPLEFVAHGSVSL